MKTGMNKLENIRNASNRIRETIEKHKPKIVVLPECFNAPYGVKYFDEYAENIPDGVTSKTLSDLAKELKVFLVGGTIPERDNNDNKLYNTCTVWSPSGDLFAKYRKVDEIPWIIITFCTQPSDDVSLFTQIHLFDIDVKGGIRFKESDALTPGNTLSILNLDGFKIGLGICYDIRFDELARIYRNNGIQKQQLIST